MLLKGFNVRTVAAAVLFQHVSHVNAGLLLALGAGGALLEVLAYMRDFFEHILCVCFFLGDNVTQVHFFFSFTDYLGNEYSIYYKALIKNCKQNLKFY
jgi:hypothetical protein